MMQEESHLTPTKIVSVLDRYIVGQKNAKKAVAIALRNRWRRMQLGEDVQKEIIPKNILMIGSTGVGKTEIARRLARLSDAPFVKVEATKFTEVGYVGRDVDSIIRDIMSASMQSTRKRHEAKHFPEAQKRAYVKIAKKIADKISMDKDNKSIINKIIEDIKKDKFDDMEISIMVNNNNANKIQVPDMPESMSMNLINISDTLERIIPGMDSNKKDRKVTTVKKALEIVAHEEVSKMINENDIIKEAKVDVEQKGIVFLDEIDKIVASGSRGGADISREGVQRDLLPLIEGTSVATKYGNINTEHILFIASGAFHVSKPSDMLPELQGRLPVRVELESLTKDDMKRILVEPEFSIIKQYQLMMSADGVKLSFSDESLTKIATIAAELNKDVENIGARRLHTILENVLQDIAFQAPDIITDSVYDVTEEIIDKALKTIIEKKEAVEFIL